MQDLLITWNTKIGKYYFEDNESNIEISLDIDEKQFIKISKEVLCLNGKEQILCKYCAILKKENGYIKNFETSLKKWKNISIDSKINNYPSFMFYIPTLFIPFSSGKANNDFNTNNFYDILYDYWQPYGLFENRGRNLLQRFYPLIWELIEEWLNEIWDGEKGLYFFEEERNDRGINYVNKVFEHVALRKQSILNLPHFFNQQGILPQTFISNESWIKYLKDDTYNLLKIPTSIKNKLSEEDKLTLRIINKVKNYHKNWNGFVKEGNETNNISYECNNKTIARFRLCLRLEENPFDDILEINDVYFRLFSESGMIRNLTFRKHKIEQERDNWSKKIIGFQPNFEHPISEIVDEHNWELKYKWKFPIILVRGGRMGLPHWVEVSEVDDLNQDAVIIFKRYERNGFLTEIKQKQLSQITIPNKFKSYCFYKVNLREVNMDLLSDMVEVSSKPKIVIHNKLSIDRGRAFFKRLLPTFSILNAEQGDEVFLEFGNRELIELIEKRNEDSVFYKIPNNISINNAFKIKSLEIEPLKGFFKITNFQILNTKPPTWRLDNKEMITLNRIYTSVNFKIENELDNFINIIKKDNRIAQNNLFWTRYFRIKETKSLNKSDLNKYCKIVNTLIEYLSTKRLVNFQEYKRAYEIISNQFFPELDGEQCLLNRKKCFYSMRALGFIDSNFEERKLFVNAPTLIRIPNNQGVRYLLTGARSFDLIKSLFDKIKVKQTLAIDIKEKAEKELMLPQSIFIKGKSEEDNRLIVRIAKSLEIQMPDIITQQAYFNFSQKIERFKEEVIRRNPNRLRYSGGRYFCTEEVKFKPITDKINRFENLITYTLDYGSFITLLGIDKNQYEVDKNYSVFYRLYQKQKNIILYDEARNYLALPATIHFPFYIDRGLTLLSGYLPEWKFIENARLKNRKYNIYTKVTKDIAENIAASLGQNLIKQEIKKS